MDLTNMLYTVLMDLMSTIPYMVKGRKLENGPYQYVVYSTDGFGVHNSGSIS